MNNKSFGYLNGKFSELERLTISVMDRGFIYGDGCYEVIPVYHKKPFGLEEHLNRLYQGLSKISLPFAEKEYNLANMIETLLSYTNNEFEYIYLQVTRGTYPKREHIFPAETVPSVFAYVTPFAPPQYETVAKGMTAVTCQDIRWDRCDIKSISLLGNVLLRHVSQKQKADETILLRGNIATEGSTSNVFVVKDGIIMTPQLSNYILPGITRHKVIEFAKALNKRVEEKEITEEVLRSADEIWLTSSTREVVPVSLLDNAAVGKSKDYTVWKEIFTLYQTKRG